MEIAQKEILFIYNSNDLQDRQALAYAKSLPDYKIKELDLQKESLTETQVKQIADLLEIEPVLLIDQNSQIYQQSYSSAELTSNGALKAMASEPVLIKTPIAIYNDRAVPIRSPYHLVKKDLEKLPSIREHAQSPNGFKHSS